MQREVTSGSPVSFKLSDAICPSVEQALRQMTPDVELCGEVVFFSDHGEERAHFAIISAAGIDTPLIVPVSRLELMESRSERENHAARPESAAPLSDDVTRTHRHDRRE